MRVELLLNPTRGKVMRALDKLRGELTERDNLLIYYAGHGVLDVQADTGGPGMYRGGLSLVREYRILAETAELNVRSDKRRRPPHGLFGGKEGTPSWNIINPGTDDRVLPVLLMAPERLRGGDVFRHVMSGAGGYGNPLERDPEHVLDDAIAEKVSIERAAADYGVVIEAGEPPTLDAAATTRLREEMSANGGARAV